MSEKHAEIAYAIIIAVGYIWSFVQFLVNQPFDACVLLLITWSFTNYRTYVRREYRK